MSEETSNINNLSIKGPKGNEIDLYSTRNLLSAFSEDTIYAAIQDIIFSLELSKKEDYTSFVKELTNLIKGKGARTRLEHSLIAQLNILEKRKPSQNNEKRDISKVFAQEKEILNNLSSDLKLQIEITNYILEYFKNGEFEVVEKCMDVLLEKGVLLNTVKNFIKKEINFYIAEQDAENVKRIAQKYGAHPQLNPLIKELLSDFIEKKKNENS